MKRIIYNHIPSTFVLGVSLGYSTLEGGRVNLIFDIGSHSLCFVLRKGKGYIGD